MAMVSVSSTSSRPKVDINYACLMKALAQPTPTKLNEYVSIIEGNPGAWSNDFYELSVSGGTLNAVFWPRRCIKREELERHEWTLHFIDQIFDAAGRWAHHLAG